MGMISWSGDSDIRDGKACGRKMLVETVEGERRSAGRGHHGKVVKWGDDRGGSTWKYECGDDCAAGQKKQCRVKTRSTAAVYSCSIAGSGSRGEAKSTEGMQGPANGGGQVL